MFDMWARTGPDPGQLHTVLPCDYICHNIFVTIVLVHNSGMNVVDQQCIWARFRPYPLVLLTLQCVGQGLSHVLGLNKHYDLARKCQIANWLVYFQVKLASEASPTSFSCYLNSSRTHTFSAST